MSQLTTNFTRDEFACKCGCGFNTVDVELIAILEEVRAEFGPVYINSACRCVTHNAAVAGSKRSQHLLGRAADIVVKNVAPAKVADFIDNLIPDRGGIGRYANFTHVDTRDTKARWGG